MSRVIGKARAFLADFENLFAWYVEEADVEVAWRFQIALDKTLMKLSIRPDLGRPAISIIGICPACARFRWSVLSEIFWFFIAQMMRCWKQFALCMVPGIFRAVCASRHPPAGDNKLEFEISRGFMEQ